MTLKEQKQKKYARELRELKKALEKWENTLKLYQSIWKSKDVDNSFDTSTKL